VFIFRGHQLLRQQSFVSLDDSQRRSRAEKPEYTSLNESNDMTLTIRQTNRSLFIVQDVSILSLLKDSYFLFYIIMDDSIYNVFTG
jgi:hypothetical protein